MQAKLIALLAFFVQSLALQAQFFGGLSTADNHRGVIQSVCTSSLIDLPFYGGIGRGEANATILQTTCHPYTANFIFQGGVRSGQAKNELWQTVCSTTTNFMFLGGIRDGFGLGIIEQSYCPFITVLPIELVEFEVRLIGDKAEIAWATETETNNDYFIIEKSSNILRFDSLGKVNGAGTSTKKLHYNFIDHRPSIGANYYRLKQVDFDGTTAYSTIRQIEYLPENVFTIYPNPNDGSKFSISVSIPIRGKSSVSVFDMLGRKLATKILSANESHADLHLSPPLRAGTYSIKLNTGTGSYILKLIVK